MRFLATLFQPLPIVSLPKVKNGVVVGLTRDMQLHASLKIFGSQTRKFERKK
jgi:hypothetical protein